nr:putative ribonuclease h protein [Quercus suber]
MFLAETWSAEARLRKVCADLKFDHCWIGPSAGKSGCLALFWKNSVHIEVVSDSPNHIDAIVGEAAQEQWRREALMMAFRDVLDECGFMDLEYVGEKYTWKGNRTGGLVLERLDRALATNDWVSLNLGTKVRHLNSHSSDHKAIVIKLEGIVPRPNRPFKFEQMWLKDKGCSNTVTSAWGSNSGVATMTLIAKKLKKCGEKLSEWSLQSFGCIKKQIESKGKMLSKAEESVALGKADFEVVKILRAELNALLDKESLMWEQRARALFLKCGDRNTRYFHSKASHRKKVVSVPGFYKKKSQRNQSQPLSESQAQPQPKNNQVPVGHSDSPYGSVNDNSKSQEFQSRAGNPFPVLAENATADLPLNLPSQPDFEELIKDIDRDICRFDSEVTSLQNSNASPPATNLINSSPPTYHPGPAPGSILDAKAANGSFAWKSILKGSDALVSVLIDHSKNCWIEEVVDNTFLPHEADVIKAIPLSLDDVVDVRFWSVSADGIYTVKSGYKLIMENELRVLPSSSNLSLSKKVWKGIWSLRTPNRVKSLLWRAGLDALPSRVNLRKRKILTNDTCPQCNLAGETSLHALWSCPCLSPIWLAHFGWLIKDASDCTSLLDIIQLCQEKSNLLDLFAVTVSLIWARRNQLRVGEKVFPVSSVSSVAVDSLHEFQIASNTPKRASPSVCPPKWSPPPPDQIAHGDGGSRG